MINSQHVALLHPGEMGVSVAATIQNSGFTVYWASEGRSAETRSRAEKVGLVDGGSLAQVVDTCPVIVSVCPPDAAEALAQRVLDCGFTGLYIDVNAISPGRAGRIGGAMAAAGASFVDGSIIGGPAWKPNSTWLYLSGEEAERAAGYFSAGPLETQVIGGGVGKASALKMCFAAYTKGSTALLSAVVAAAEALKVRDELEAQWSQGDSDFAEETAQKVRRVTAKAWRFAGEMDEIAATFEEAGLPGGFHQASADIYRRMAGFKGAADVPQLFDVLAALLGEK